MSESEFEVLDNLYFLTRFEELQRATGIDENTLIDELVSLLNKEWVKVFNLTGDTEISIKTNELKSKIKEYAFLISKSGLFAHNSR